MVKPKKMILFSAAGLILLLLLLFFLDKTEPKHMEAKTITLENENILQEVEDTNLRIRNFVLTKVPFEDVFLKFELPDSHGNSEEHSHSTSIPLELLKEEAVNTFYSAIINNDVDQLAMVLTSESLFSLWEKGENDIEKREQLVSDYLQGFYRDGDLQEMTYSFKRGSFDSVMNEGIFNLKYKDGSDKEIPFKFVEMGEGHHEMLQLELRQN